MNKESIANLLDEKNEALLNYLRNQDAEKWEVGPNGKWTSGQQALHLLQCIKPLNDALSMPKFLVQYRFGKTNQQIQTYDDLVKNYLERSSEFPNFIFEGSRDMKVPTITDKNYILNRLQVESKKLQYKTLRISDKNLDTLLLPHPTMGKMPIREIIMWTAHHIDHHTRILQEKY